MTDWLKLKDAVRLMCREGLISIVVSNDFLAALDVGYRAESEVDRLTGERPVLIAEVQQLLARVAELEASWKAATEYNGRMDAVAMQANRQRDAALDVLREVEYVRGKQWGQAEDCCPACGAHEDYEHRPDCKIAAALNG